MKKKIFVVLAIMIVSAMTLVGCSGKNKDVPENASTITGVIEEVKDFMITIEDENGAAYVMGFEEAPEGLDQVKAGDQVVVTYTGTLNEVDAFTGEILSIEKK